MFQILPRINLPQPICIGSRDSGDLAAGSRDSGDLAAGSRDSGDLGAGSRDSGDLGAGSRESGDLAAAEAAILVVLAVLVAVCGPVTCPGFVLAIYSQFTH